jgi:hypothetical protein
VSPLARIRLWIGLFVVGLVLSGVTAFPLPAEVRWISTWPLPGFAAEWIGTVRAGLESAPPLLSYGTDWLAFAVLLGACKATRRRMSFGVAGLIPLWLALRQTRMVSRAA